MTDRSTCRARPIAMLLAAGLAGAGCVERDEEIVVEADGTVRVRLEFASKSFDDLYLGDAVPALEGGWLVREEVERDDEGEKTYRLHAEALFPPDLDLPSSFAGPRDADPDLFLQFPTTVTIEPRRDGTWFHFRRRYPARPWATTDAARRTLERRVAELEGRSFETLGVAERRALVAALAQFRMARAATYARAAYLDALDDVPQDRWLAVHRALADAADGIDAARVLEAVLDDEGRVDDEALEVQQASFEAAALEAVERVLRDTAALAPGRVNEFLRRYEWHRGFDEITEDLGDDRFEVVVRLPGTVMGHNGDRAEGASVTWTFDGTAVRDRPLELMASSRLP